MSKKIGAFPGAWTQTGDAVPKVTAAPDLTDEINAFTYEK